MKKDIKYLVVHNDEIHSINEITYAFVEIIGMNPHQALQCAELIHNSGKYSVKSGKQKELEFHQKVLEQLNIKSTIE